MFFSKSKTKKNKRKKIIQPCSFVKITDRLTKT